MKYNKLILSIIAIATSSQVHAVDYISMNFDDGNQPPTQTGLPTFALPPVFGDNYGPGNFFEVTNSTSNSGGFSLKFNYAGQNGFGNTCGLNALTHLEPVDTNDAGVDYFVSKDGVDLASIHDVGTTNEKGPAAKPGNLVFNKTRGGSAWVITEVLNQNAIRDRVNLKLIKPAIDGSANVFKNNDSASFARRCGIDGIIGILDDEFQLSRRSDIDSVTTWLTDIPVGIQGADTSLFRRVYLKAEYTRQPGGNKISNVRLNSNNPDTTALQALIVLNADSNESDTSAAGLEPFPKLDFPNQLGGGEPVFAPGKGLPAALKFKRNTWYYIEQEFKAQSAPGVMDGEYRLWFYEAGSESATPVLELTGLNLPPVYGGTGQHMSLWGNVHHEKNTYGAWYMDDFVISNTYNGAVSGSSASNKSVPNPPTP